MRGSHATAAVLLALLIAWVAPLARGEGDVVRAFAAQLSEAAQWDAERFSERAGAFSKLVSGRAR
jgi:hypothetical protein